MYQYIITGLAVMQEVRAYIHVCVWALVAMRQVFTFSHKDL